MAHLEGKLAEMLNRASQMETHVQHAGVVHIHGFPGVCGAILVVEIDAGIVDEYVHTAILLDLFGKVAHT